MATADGDPLARVAAQFDRALARVGLDRVEFALVGVSLLALLARLYDLGARTAHWDEARVGYWILRYVETGSFEYRPIIHGPFYQHVNRLIFELLGATDATMRLAPAVVGGLLPLTALLFRDRLGDAAAVALGLLLAANPVVLYYTRFMRGDPLVAAFMFGAFAFFVRTVDTGRTRYFYPGVALVALGLTAKENALLYLVTWVGASALLLDHRLFLARARDRSWPSVLTDYLWAGYRTLRAWLVPLLVGVVELLAIVVYFYAPRAGEEAGPGLWQVHGVSSAIDVVHAATVGSWQEFWGTWIESGHQDHAYLPFLSDFLTTMAHGAIAISVFAVLGFLADRYARDRPSDLISFAFYWGFVSVLGYPIVTDIKSPWAPMHAIVPLAIPAAVGLATVYRWAREAYENDEFVDLGLAMVVLLLVAAQVGATSVDAVYRNPQSGDNELVQFAQPADDISELVATMDGAAADPGTPDVLLHGDYYVEGATNATREPACAKWFNTLPLPWYFERANASVECTETEAGLRGVVQQSEPALVIVRTEDREPVHDELRAYRWRYHLFRAWGDNSTVYVHEDYWDGMDLRENEAPVDPDVEVPTVVNSTATP